MFRRKEDEVNDSESATNSGSDTNSGESATVLTSSSTSNNSTSGASSSTYGAANANPYATGATPSGPLRSAADTSAATRPIATPFRAGANATAETARGRSTEKPASSPLSSAIANTSSAKENRRVLTVGSDILLKGEIATCDRLVIEGKVDATLNDVHTVEIAEAGSFKGTAQIEYAEISGLFEGELIVKNRLIIYASGKVRGKITYGEIEIERGGELTGEISITPDTQSNSYSRREKAAA